MQVDIEILYDSNLQTMMRNCPHRRSSSHSCELGIRVHGFIADRMTMPPVERIANVVASDRIWKQFALPKCLLASRLQQTCPSEQAWTVGPTRHKIEAHMHPTSIKRRCTRSPWLHHRCVGDAICLTTLLDLVWSTPPRHAHLLADALRRQPHMVSLFTVLVS